MSLTVSLKKEIWPTKRFIRRRAVSVLFGIIEWQENKDKDKNKARKREERNNMNNIWNYDYIQQQAQLRQQHQNQVRQVLETARKLQDFLDSADKVEAPYKEALKAECCAVLLNYAKKHGNI